MDNMFYFVRMSTFCIRKGRNGKSNTVSSENDMYSNVFENYDSAVAYARLLMMINHNCSFHNWDDFVNHIDIVDDEKDIRNGREGYVHHPMNGGMERFEGFDTTGRYPVVFDEITITCRKVHGSYDDCGNESALEAVQIMHGIDLGKASEFTKEQQESHQEAVDRIADEIGGIDDIFNGLCDKGADDFDRMMEAIRRHEP